MHGTGEARLGAGAAEGRAHLGAEGRRLEEGEDDDQRDDEERRKGGRRRPQRPVHEVDQETWLETREQGKRQGVVTAVGRRLSGIRGLRVDGPGPIACAIRRRVRQPAGDGHSPLLEPVAAVLDPLREGGLDLAHLARDLVRRGTDQIAGQGDDQQIHQDRAEDGDDHRQASLQPSQKRQADRGDEDRDQERDHDR